MLLQVLYQQVSRLLCVLIPQVEQSGYVRLDKILGMSLAVGRKNNANSKRQKQFNVIRKSFDSKVYDY